MTELNPVGETVAAEGIIPVRKEKAEKRALHKLSRDSRTEYEDPEEILVSEDGLAVSEDEYG